MISRRLPSALTALLWFSILAPMNVRSEWKNSLRPAGNAGGNVVLVKDGKSVRQIQIAKTPTVIERKAAEELQNWIEQITSGRPAIKTEDTGPTVTIRTDAGLGEEGYRISIEGDDLVLTGGKGRGVMNAVFAFLEEDIGCRFYTNDSIKLPTGKTLSVRPVARTFVP